MADIVHTIRIRQALRRTNQYGQFWSLEAIDTGNDGISRTYIHGGYDAPTYTHGSVWMVSCVPPQQQHLKTWRILKASEDTSVPPVQPAQELEEHVVIHNIKQLFGSPHIITAHAGGHRKQYKIAKSCGSAFTGRQGEHYIFYSLATSDPVTLVRWFKAPNDESVGVARQVEDVGKNMVVSGVRMSHATPRTTSYVNNVIARIAKDEISNREGGKSAAHWWPVVMQNASGSPPHLEGTPNAILASKSMVALYRICENIASGSAPLSVITRLSCVLVASTALLAQPAGPDCPSPQLIPALHLWWRTAMEQAEHSDPDQKESYRTLMRLQCYAASSASALCMRRWLYPKKRDELAATRSRARRDLDGLRFLVAWYREHVYEPAVAYLDTKIVCALSTATATAPGWMGNVLASMRRQCSNLLEHQTRARLWCDAAAQCPYAIIYHYHTNVDPNSIPPTLLDNAHELYRRCTHPGKDLMLHHYRLWEYLQRDVLNNGHTCSPLDDALLLEADLTMEQIMSVIHCFGTGGDDTMQRFVPPEAQVVGLNMGDQGTWVSLGSMYDTESGVATLLKQLDGRKTADDEEEAVDKDRVDAIATEMNLNEGQKQALQHVAAHHVSIIRGEAGTGKSHLTAAIVQLITGSREAPMDDVSKRKALCCVALPGKACQVLQERAKWPAATIHSTFARSAEPLDPEVVLVDECGLIGMNEVRLILVGCGTSLRKIVFIGDEQQLAPIGAGRFFADLIAARPDWTSTLSEPWRHSGSGTILSNAQAVLRGVAPTQTDGDNSLRITYTPQFVTVVYDLAVQWKDHWRTAAVLAYRRKDVASLNVYLRSLWNPGQKMFMSVPRKVWASMLQKKMSNSGSGSSTSSTTAEGSPIIYGVGDRFMWCRNDYTTFAPDTLRNGQVGYLEDASMYIERAGRPTSRNILLPIHDTCRARVLTIADAEEVVDWDCVMAVARASDSAPAENAYRILYHLSVQLSVSVSAERTYKYDADGADRNIIPAFGMTIHKAIGSDFERVAVLVGDSVGEDRSLLYTAMTRATKELVLVVSGSADTLQAVVDRTQSDANHRRTALPLLLTK